MEINEEVKVKMLQYLESLESVMKSGTDFVADQMPLVLQEYIVYNRCYSTVVVVMSIIMIIIAYKMFDNGLKLGSTNARDLELYAIAYIMFGAIFGIVSFIIFCHNFDTMLKSWAAPRLLVLTQISELVKAIK